MKIANGVVWDLTEVYHPSLFPFSRCLLVSALAKSPERNHSRSIKKSSGNHQGIVKESPRNRPWFMKESSGNHRGTCWWTPLQNLLGQKGITIQDSSSIGISTLASWLVWLVPFTFYILHPRKITYSVCSPSRNPKPRKFYSNGIRHSCFCLCIFIGSLKLTDNQTFLRLNWCNSGW